MGASVSAKTHLMHAVAWHVSPAMRANRKVIYLSAEKFMYQFIRAITIQINNGLQGAIRSVDLLMIDDVQFISGKDSTQEDSFTPSMHWSIRIDKS